MNEEVGDTPDDPVLRIEPCAGTEATAISQVVFFQSTFEAKIQTHEELAATGHGIPELAQTVSKPAAVYDGNRPGRNYVFVSGTLDFMGHPLIVTAQRFEDTTSARFSSAYYTSDFENRDPVWTAVGDD